VIVLISMKPGDKVRAGDLKTGDIFIHSGCLTFIRTTKNRCFDINYPKDEMNTSPDAEVTYLGKHFPTVVKYAAKRAAKRARI
jgi:hypothetical protein